MQAFHPGTGMTIEFPDNTPDEEIQSRFATAQASMPPRATTLAQQFLTGIRDTQQQQQLAPPPVNGGGFVGLDPQQAQFMLQQRQNQAALQQQSASEAARNRIAQQKMDQDAIEGEKGRSLEIKLFKERFKNDRELAGIEAEVSKFKAEQEAAGKKADMQHDITLENLRQSGRADLQQDRLAGQREIAQMRASKPEGIKWELDTIQMRNAETGQVEDVRAYVAPGQQPQVVGPAPVRKQDANGLSPEQRIRAINDTIKNNLEADLYSGNTRTYDQVVKDSIAFVDMVSGVGPDDITQQPQQQPQVLDGPSPEQQEEMRILRQSGAQVAFDPRTGEVVYVGGR